LEVKVNQNTLNALCSEKVGLAHNAHELLFVDGVVVITVSLVNHFLDFFVGHVLTELLGHTLEVLKGDFAVLLVVEEAECLEHLLARVTFSHLLGHHIEELREVNDTGAILVDVGDHFLDLLALGLETKGAHGNLKFLLVDVARAISVEKVESLLDFLLLFFS
jgi:hypothetical protein